MVYTVEDLEDQNKFRLFLTLSYTDLIPFIFDSLKKKSGLMIFFWALCIIFLFVTVFIRIKISGYFPESGFLHHSVIGLIILPIIFIPVHELLHVIPYYFSGAKNIRIGMDLKQYMFYVTAHKYVATPFQFRLVALVPIIIISLGLILSIILLPGLWKWSLSLFLFVHATMCAGDIALLNLYWVNKNKKIYTWDDVEKKEAYFYEKLED
jgi:Putative zincin peptidase